MTFAVQVGEHGSHAHLTSQRRTWVAAHQDLPSVAVIQFGETVVLQSHATKLINWNMIIPIQMCTKTQKLLHQGMPRGEDSPVLQALSILPSATVEMNPRRTMAGRLLHGVQLVSSIGSHPLWNLIDSEIPLKFPPFRFRKVAMKKSKSLQIFWVLLLTNSITIHLPNDAYCHQCYHGCLHEIVFGIIKLGSTRLQQSFQPDAKLSSCQAIIICGFG